MDIDVNADYITKTDLWRYKIKPKFVGLLVVAIMMAISLFAEAEIIHVL